MLDEDTLHALGRPGGLCDGSRYYRRGEDPCIPFEFADAADRYRHSQIQQSYQVSPTSAVPVFPDLIGFGALGADHAVDWALQIDIPGRLPAQRDRRIDGRLPASLIALPTTICGARAGEDYGWLAVRDLQCGALVGLPSGETIATHLDVTALTVEPAGMAAVGIIDADPESVRSVDPGWQPTLPGRTSAYGLAEVLLQTSQDE